MTAALDVEPRWLSLVRDIIRDHAPCPCRVHVFGSRVQGRARRFSDLDLAFDAGRPLTLHEQVVLFDAFDESDLPWRVDVVDLATCSPEFRSVVEAQAVPLLDLGAGCGEGLALDSSGTRRPPSRPPSD